MDVREKLVELLSEKCMETCKQRKGYVCSVEECKRSKEKCCGFYADHLISNGVTVQEWVSIDDRLPENGKEGVLIVLRWGEVDIGWCEDGRWRSEFVNEYEEGEVTHWMLLPQPPKGVNDGESVD